MAHQTPRSSYRQLSARLNRFPQGAPSSELLFRILSMLFSEQEAELVARLPLRPFTVEGAARDWGVGLEEARNILDRLAGRALLVDMRCGEKAEYVLPPPMAGFFEFALMRVRDDLDQKLLAQLYEQYITVEEDFIRGLAEGGTTQQGRMLVHEAAIPAEHSLEVLDWERASAIIAGASEVAVGLCYCRHKRRHLGRACEAPLEVCMTLNGVAESLIRHGTARRASRMEALELLHGAREGGLVQFGENVQRGVNFICNCCSCCCEALISHRRFGHLHPIHTSNFLAAIGEGCSGCGACLPACPVQAIALHTTGATGHGIRRAVIDPDRCLGCGVCPRACRPRALHMAPRPTRILTPVNSVHRTVLMAIERGTLQHLVFDRQVLWSHRALAAMLGAVLRLPPAKRLLATEQVRSRYLARLCERFDPFPAAGTPGDGVANQ